MMMHAVSSGPTMMWMVIQCVDTDSNSSKDLRR
jgi:hypothetical protein